jgi:hypothetical protein
MKQLLQICSVMLISFTGISQTIIDTIETANGQIVIFDDKSWGYLNQIESNKVKKVVQHTPDSEDEHDHNHEEDFNLTEAFLDEGVDEFEDLSEEELESKEDFDYNGLINPRIFQLIEADTTLHLVQRWDNSVCYTSAKSNDLTKLKDTLWLCVVDEENADFCLPFDGTITSRYGFRKGRYHNGIDIDLEKGDSVRSCWSGVVRYAKFNTGGFGNLVIVRHHNGLESFYAHLSQLNVEPNQVVNAGDLLGLGGTTGRSYGTHLHFELRFYDAPINPEEIIDFEAKVCKDENLLLYRDIFMPGAKPSDSKDFTASVNESQVRKTNNTSRKYYRIRSGDSLSVIASRNHTTVSRLCQLNGIRPTTTLQIGRNIRVR